MMAVHHKSIGPDLERPWSLWPQRIYQLLVCHLGELSKFRLAQGAVVVQRLERRLTHRLPRDGSYYYPPIGHALAGRCLFFVRSLKSRPKCIYINVYTSWYAKAMAVTKVFRSGNSQAVRIPRRFQFRSKQVEIFRRGEEIVIREPRRSLTRAFQLLAKMSPDFFRGGRKQPKLDKRAGL
jgi:antitoxin VapB